MFENVTPPTQIISQGGPHQQPLCRFQASIIKHGGLCAACVKIQLFDARLC